MYPYRIFISYSHKDSELARKLRAHLQSIGARPMSDVDIAGGKLFSDEIRRQISFAHIFVTLLTANSKERPWVHQEIGYALGLRVPVLPLALAELPEGMAQEIQAIKVNPHLSDLDQLITESLLDEVVFTAQRAATAPYECADMLYQRTKVLVDNATLILKQYGSARIRQRMAFSSFSIPRRHIRHSDWDLREGNDPRSLEVRALLLEERRIMEEHAREAGCDLVLDPSVGASSTMVMGKNGTRGPTMMRLKTLVEFLESMPDDKVRVVFQQGTIDGGVHIIGDWFASEAVVPYYKGGYRQTMFTRHAPTVLSKLRAFDNDFEDMLEDNSTGTPSRQVAIEALKDMIQG